MNMSGEQRFRNILVAGLPGTGKSTFARAYAQLSRTEYVELDRYVERLAGRSISEIFAQDGEHAFRELEATCLERLLKRQRCTIALGGGTLTHLPSLKLAQELGCIVLLTAPTEVLVQRLWNEKSHRPLIADCATQEELAQRLESLRQQREETYAQADLQLETEYSSVDTLKIELDWFEKCFFAGDDGEFWIEAGGYRQIPVADAQYRSPREQRGQKEISDKMERFLKAQRHKERGERREKREKKPQSQQNQQPRRTENVEGARLKMEAPRPQQGAPRPVTKGSQQRQDAPRSAQSGPRPRQAQGGGPRPVQDGPRAVQDGPRAVQNGPRPTQNRPRPQSESSRSVSDAESGPANSKND